MNKLLVIAPYPYLPYFSGGQKFIARFLESLANQVELTVICTRKNDPTLATNYRSIPLLKGSFSRYFDLSLPKKISDEIIRGKYDAVIWEHPYFSWAARRIRKKTGVPYIIQTHNIEYQRFRSLGKWWWPFLRSYEKKALKMADAILFITPEDRQFAMQSWSIDRAKSIDVPFGIDIKDQPVDRKTSRDLIAEKHQLGSDEKIILFNGLLNYKPNLDALNVILEKINPILRKAEGFRYKIIVCGKGLPVEMGSLEGYNDRNIVYAGFVNDIEPYFKAADIFLNPVQSGGGIKTKMVEAIAYGTTVISTETGATGIIKEVCGEKLVVTADNDWTEFTKAIVENVSRSDRTPDAFYEYYFQGNITKRLLQELTHHFPATAKNQ